MNEKTNPIVNVRLLFEPRYVILTWLMILNVCAAAGGKIVTTATELSRLRLIDSRVPRISRHRIIPALDRLSKLGMVGVNRVGNVMEIHPLTEVSK
jgi:hypothetical protein